MIDLKPIKLIHLLFCSSALLFALVVCFINKEQLIFDFTLTHPDQKTNIMSFVAIIFTVVSMNLGTYIFNRMIRNIDPEMPLKEKFEKYQVAFLIKCALLEAASIFSIVMCLLTYNSYFIIVASFSLIALWLMKPTEERVYTALQLKDTDIF